MIDVKELKILNKKECDCGHVYTLKDFTKLEQLQDAHGFYGNLVKYYSRAKCPNCNKEVILLLKQKGQTWEIMNTAITKEMNKEEMPVVQQMTSQVITEPTEIENKEENKQDEEFICSICKKVCKNKSGLTAHMRTHQN